MSPGYTTYLRFKANLVLRNQSLTGWASDRGTGPQQVRQVVVTYAGSDRMPTHPMSLQILAAVYAELAEMPVLTEPAL